jgi:hypothetical protein
MQFDGAGVERTRLNCPRFARTFDTLRQSQWEEEGCTIYGLTLAAEEFDDFSHDERRREARKAA